MSFGKESDEEIVDFVFYDGAGHARSNGAEGGRNATRISQIIPRPKLATF